MPEFSTQLRTSAGHFARSALQALPTGGDEVFALHAGTAVEHLAKALLADKHPALIAANDFESLLHACGEEAVATGSVMRTINVTESIKRATRFVPRLSVLKDDLVILAEARNGVAHLGHPADGSSLRVSFLKACELLREELRIERVEFWGDFGSLVDAALEESVKEAKVRVENAIAAARINFRTRYGHLDRDAAATALLAVEANYYPPETDEQVIPCPACDSRALVNGAVLGRWETDDPEQGADFYATFIPGQLHCGACELELNGEDEIQAAGIEEEWEVDVDPDELFNGWEPDWDFSR